MLREPVVAGKFYEADSSSLREQINGCFNHHLGAANAKISVAGRLAAFIAPHAGFMFSGPVASHDYARLASEEPFPDTVILLGPKHTHYGADFSVSAATAWKTPFGDVDLDRELCQKLVSEIDLLESDNDAHMFEHSIEVQLPFLQYFSPKMPAIVPIALHYSKFETVCELASGIKRVIAGETGKRILIIASSDFSHDTPRDEAYRLDAQVIDKILQLDAKAVYDLIIDEGRSVCGVIPITALLLILSGLSVKPRLLKYATSMDVMRHERGVGYGAIIFEEY